MVRRRLRRAASRATTVYRTRTVNTRRRYGRGRKKDTMKRDLKKGAIGGAAGLALSIGLTMAGRYTNQPMLGEVGQRAGAVAATWVGGLPGQIAYQVGDAVFDRFVNVDGGSISGQGFVGV